MSKKAEPGGERPPNRGRATPRAARHHNASAHREAPARPRRVPNDYVTFQEAGTSEASVHHQGDGRFPGGGAEAVDDQATVSPPTGRPYYIPAWQRRRERPPDDPRYEYGRMSMRPVGAPPLGPRPTGNGGFRTTTKVGERVSTIKPDDGGAADQAAPPLAPPPGRNGGSPPQHQDQPTPHYQPRLPRQHRPWSPTRLSEGKSPVILSPDRRNRRKRPAAFCFTLCCILFWLAVILIGAAVLTVYLLHRLGTKK